MYDQAQIERFKKEAKRWKKDAKVRALADGGSSLTHAEALDLVAQREGFATWAELMNMNNAETRSGCNDIARDTEKKASDRG